MTLSIICPLYKGEKYIDSLNESLLNQKDVDIKEILYIVTETNGDNSIEKLNKLKANYKVILPEEFSHSLTREKAAYEAKGDIIVFISQDIVIEDDKWLYNLVIDIVSGICDAAFSKQICTNNTIERYTRMKNYPDKSRIASKDTIKDFGIMSYFYSDASSAIRKDVFVKLKGYDNKDLLTNEDMYIAYKLINNGYKIKYCANSKVVHSHKYSYKTLFKRYFDQGVFLKQHPYIYESGANNSAISLVKFVFSRAIKEKNLMAVLDIIPNFGVRFIANKIGYKYKRLSENKILKYTSNKNYWIRNRNI